MVDVYAKTTPPGLGRVECVCHFRPDGCNSGSSGQLCTVLALCLGPQQPSSIQMAGMRDKRESAATRSMRLSIRQSAGCTVTFRMCAQCC
jgi:hypothetical protein